MLLLHCLSHDRVVGYLLCQSIFHFVSDVPEFPAQYAIILGKDAMKFNNMYRVLPSQIEIFACPWEKIFTSHKEELFIIILVGNMGKLNVVFIHSRQPGNFM